MCGLDKHFMWRHPWCFFSMFRSTVLICFYGVILSRRCSLPWLHSSWYRSHLSRSLLPQMMWRWILMKYIVGKSDCFSACLWRICRRSWESYRCCLMLGPDVLSKCALWDSYYFLWFMQGELWNNIDIEHVDFCFFFKTSKKAELRNGRTRLSCREPSTRPSRYVLRKLKMSSDVVHLKGSEMDMRSINCRGFNSCTCMALKV